MANDPFNADLPETWCDGCGEPTPEDELTVTVEEDQLCPDCLEEWRSEEHLRELD